MTRGGVGRVLGLLVSLLAFYAGAAPERDQDARVALDAGGVLVAGGRAGGRVLARCEVYAPDTGRWRETGALRTPRARAAAVRLADGRVLVVGGASRGARVLASAEVYSPASGRWTPVAPLSEAREDPAVVRLADGRVLVVGGVDAERRPVRSAELYDPERDAWTRAADPLATRAGTRSGVLLEDGRALFVSGLQAELYSPGTDTWTRAGPAGGAAGTHRAEHTVTRLGDGRVLVVGGWTARAATTAEVFSPTSGDWTLVAAPGTAREGHAARLLGDGRVRVEGGFQHLGSARASGETYDPVADRWSEEPPRLGSASTGEYAATPLLAGRAEPCGRPRAWVCGPETR
jgi:hypothetical protein